MLWPHDHAHDNGVNSLNTRLKIMVNGTERRRAQLPSVCTGVTDPVACAAEA